MPALLIPPQQQEHLDEDGTLRLSFWRFDGTPLTAPDPSSTPFRDGLELTTHFIDQLRKTNYKKAREILKSSQEIQRYIYRKRGGAALPLHQRPRRRQQASALAAHILLPQRNVKSCGACRRGRGPLATCVSFGEDVFGGACSCCQYARRAGQCTFHLYKKGPRFAELLDEEEHEEIEEDNPLIWLNEETVKTIPTETLEQWLGCLEDEMMKREENGTLASNGKGED
ncbi:hypothetical protein GGS21DRAFT_519222, partial [Xylaria nigripes]